MKVIEKAFLIFDNLYMNEDQAKKVLQGWEHKERVDTVYFLISEEDQKELYSLDQENQTDFLHALSPYMFDEYWQAEEDLKEWSEEQ